MILRLEPPLPFETPKGKGYAHFLIDDGQEHHLQWVVFLDDGGECWTFENPDIRLQDNLTMGRPPKAHKWRKYWDQIGKDKKDNGRIGQGLQHPPPTDDSGGATGDSGEGD